MTGEERPTPGDFSICLYCAMTCVFNTDMTLRTLKPEELKQLSQGTQLSLEKMRWAVLLANQTYEQGPP